MTKITFSVNIIECHFSKKKILCPLTHGQKAFRKPKITFHLIDKIWFNEDGGISDWKGKALNYPGNTNCMGSKGYKCVFSVD